MKKLWLTILCLFLLTGCASAGKKTPTEPPENLAALAYDNYGGWDSRVYILEDERYVPYLVLTDDYNGNCLLLREHLMPGKQEYNDPKLYYVSYYEDSWIDQYLNEEVYELYSDFITSQMVDSSIVITATESLEYSREFTSTIQRKVFLLSYSELNFNCPSWDIFLEEGPKLEYFENWKKRIAYYENGELSNWWLRTPDATSRQAVCAVGIKGEVGSAGLMGINGITRMAVRPAFCLPGDLSIAETDLNGESVFVLAGESFEIIRKQMVCRGSRSHLGKAKITNIRAVPIRDDSFLCPWAGS